MPVCDPAVLPHIAHGSGGSWLTWGDRVLSAGSLTTHLDFVVLRGMIECCEHIGAGSKSHPPICFTYVNTSVQKEGFSSTHAVYHGPNSPPRLSPGRRCPLPHCVDPRCRELAWELGTMACTHSAGQRGSQPGLPQFPGAARIPTPTQPWRLCSVARCALIIVQGAQA